MACFGIGACLGSGASLAAGALSGLSRVATGFFSRRFSHSLLSLRNEPAAQVILVQRSPSAL
jgi:hypothetical protein